MRLIDVDDFVKDNAWKWEASGGSEDYYYSVEYLTTRHSVEAIPVEWIKDIIRRCLEMMKSDVSDCYTSINYSLTAQLLAQLLESWEEEK